VEPLELFEVCDVCDVFEFLEGLSFLFTVFSVAWFFPDCCVFFVFVGETLEVDDLEVDDLGLEPDFDTAFLGGTCFPVLKSNPFSRSVH
jgi:hypothetical protein